MTAGRARDGAPNRLALETSPYLLQHAHNPVDWRPWGPEALACAQEEDRPILLSIGYSACHWCHVMARESFEDPETASLMNELFVSIKVDREERPDIDAIYMAAVQAMTGHGGWPLTVFLTPEAKPFYGGTYYPPELRDGMPSFRQVLLAIADAWRNRRQELLGAGDRLADVLGRSPWPASAATGVPPDLLARAAARLLRSVDLREGGFGAPPKFPQPMILDFLLRTAARTRQAELLDAATLTLTKMARGGIYDQLGGGFHRYSTDALWLVPHFEKMLYDNAQLARTYLHAWQLTGEPLFRRVTEEILDYVLHEMTSPEGGFYSAQDADSGGEEGRFFLWTPAEVSELLGPEDAGLFGAYYDVSARGNFPEGGPGLSILHVARDLDAVARDLGAPVDRLADAVARGRRVLFARREQRERPRRDEKILAEWNGLMIAALAEAGAALGRADAVAAAQRAAAFIWTSMRQADAGGQAGPAEGPAPTNARPQVRLHRSYSAGRAHLGALLEDYAAVALGFLALHRATAELRWIEAAVELAEAIVGRFQDPEHPGFHQTGDDHERLLVRRKDFVDGATPAGNSLAAELLLLLGRLLDRRDAIEAAQRIVAAMADGMAEHPAGFGRLLCVADMLLHPGHEIAIAGDPAAADTRALVAAVNACFLPNDLLVVGHPTDRQVADTIPWLAGRGMLDGRATAYVCRDYACSLPVTEPAALAEQLADRGPAGTS